LNDGAGDDVEIDIDIGAGISTEISTEVGVGTDGDTGATKAWREEV